MKNPAIYPRMLALIILSMAALMIDGCSQQSRQTQQQEATESPTNPSANPMLAFGSCLRQWQPQPVWQGIAALKPQAFIFTGDNAYTDVGSYAGQPEPKRIHQAYRDLADAPDYRNFAQFTRDNPTAIYATWDDHDYGKNDGGAEYPHKLASKQAFLNFFNLEKTASGDAGQAGIYQSDIRLINGLRVQLLLLDTRSFRSPLKKSPNKSHCSPTGTVANTDPEATILGSEQWQWLENELRQTADVRIVISSIQVIPTEHCFEKWANFPHERQRLFAVLKKSAAEGVIFISGDRHLAEISRLPAHAQPENLPYPLYEITASGLNSAMGLLASARREANRYRAHKHNVTADNFGTIEFIGQGKNTELRLQIRNTEARILQQSIVKLDSLRKSGR